MEQKETLKDLRVKTEGLRQGAWARPQIESKSPEGEDASNRILYSARSRGNLHSTAAAIVANRKEVRTQAISTSASEEPGPVTSIDPRRKDEKERREEQKERKLKQRKKREAQEKGGNEGADSAAKSEGHSGSMIDDTETSRGNGKQYRSESTSGCASPREAISISPRRESDNVGIPMRTLKRSNDGLHIRSGEDSPNLSSSPPNTDERVRKALLRSETISGADFISPRTDRYRRKTGASTPAESTVPIRSKRSNSIDGKQYATSENLKMNNSSPLPKILEPPFAMPQIPAIPNAHIPPSSLAPVRKINIDSFVDCFLEPSQSFVHRLLDYTLSLSVQERSTVTDSLVSVLMKHNKRGFVLKAVQHLVHETMKLQDSEETLFRENSVATSLLASYTRAMGTPFLELTVLPIIEKIKCEKVPDEVEDEKGEGGSRTFSAAEANHLNALMDKILKNPGWIPWSIREISRILYEETRVKFPGARYTAIVGFLFLRFICPALINPESYLGVPRLSHKVRQALISITRVIQTIANRAQEEKKVSPDALALVHKYENRIKEWVDKILSLTEGKYSETTKFISDGVYDDAIEQLLAQVTQHKENLLEIMMEDEDCTDLDPAVLALHKLSVIPVHSDTTPRCSPVTQQGKETPTPLPRAALAPNGGLKRVQIAVPATETKPTGPVVASEIPLNRCLNFLVLGNSGSGKSTFVHQLSFCHKIVARGKEKEEKRAAELRTYTSRVRDVLLEEFQSILSLMPKSLKLAKEFRNMVEEIKVAEEMTPQIGANIATLWKSIPELKDPIIRCHPSIRNAEHIIYLCSNADRIGQEHYVPNEDDKVSIFVPTTEDVRSIKILRKNHKVKLAETKTGELPKKFTQKTPDIDGIFFFVSLTEYNALPTPSEADEIISGSKKKRSKQTAEVKPQDQEQVRGWEESLQLWKKVTSNPAYSDIPFVLFMNKEDEFLRKIHYHPVQLCLEDLPTADRQNSNEIVSFLSKKFEKSFGGAKTKLFVSHGTTTSQDTSVYLFNYCYNKAVTNVSTLSSPTATPAIDLVFEMKKVKKQAKEATKNKKEDMKALNTKLKEQAAQLKAAEENYRKLEKKLKEISAEAQEKFKVCEQIKEKEGITEMWLESCPLLKAPKLPDIKFTETDTTTIDTTPTPKNYTSIT